MAMPPYQTSFSEIGSAVAPFIYFDGVPNFGFNGGIANLTLEAFCYLSIDDKVVAQRVVVAQIRTSASGLAQLKSAIEGIELLANPAPSGKSN
jgi:hypothetical protein